MFWVVSSGTGIFEPIKELPKIETLDPIGKARQNEWEILLKDFKKDFMKLPEPPSPAPPTPPTHPGNPPPSNDVLFPPPPDPMALSHMNNPMNLSHVLNPNH
ncbi:hypothetical protein BDP27DRAFT_1426791 [Rhodocollybia butyracea]|uniref:Uncharacterized protein n=1 Tax=Rhodocollybia butyracea TaxID=206335 RepID=A0A9P5PHM1_9AGAR|nr:hypothetical protein BDP27DRAFT_1426791 [Rhodocollybia butyracea]